jgi:transcriptional regulator with XRE-family HTH domain
MAKYQQWLEPEGLLLIEGWARDGLTDEQIAHNMGISRSTLNEWKDKFSDISDTIKKGKEVVDLQVENALLKRALGYSYSETTRERNKDTGEMVTTKIITKEVVPDVTAQIFWLKNRKPDQWRDKPESKEVNGGVIIVDSIPEPDNSEPN